jgi:hypothetical protein
LRYLVHKSRGFVGMSSSFTAKSNKFHLQECCAAAVSTLCAANFQETGFIAIAAYIASKSQL